MIEIFIAIIVSLAYFWWVFIGIYLINKDFCNTWAYSLNMWIHRKKIRHYMILNKLKEAK